MRASDPAFAPFTGYRGRALLLALSAAACGPSLTRVHEGTLRFEHCYRLDLEPAVATPKRDACWKLWLDSYTYGQPRDRIDYARRRAQALEKGDTEPPALHLAGERRTAERPFYLVVPEPSSVHAPPPPVATALPAPTLEADGGPSPNADAKTPPAASCAETCRSSWETCDGECGQGDPKRKRSGGASACDACRDTYAKCMRACFE